MSTAQILTNYEHCQRKSFYGLSWQRNRLSAVGMMAKAIRVAVTAPNASETAFGELAGSEVMQLAADRGLETENPEVYEAVIHTAALSDILVSAIRKPGSPPWQIPEVVQNWTSAAYLSPDGSYLRRIALVSHWSDERQCGESRAWFTLGEIEAYRLPMQIAVLVLGQQRNGRRTGSPWCSGFLHPRNHELRFRKRSKGTRTDGNVFNDKWEKILREDHAEISRETWLESMLRDDVLPDVCFKVDVEIPTEKQLQRIREMRDRKLEKIAALTEKPEANLSTCDFPVPCEFKRCCHAAVEREPSEKIGYLRIQAAPPVDELSTDYLPK